MSEKIDAIATIDKLLEANQKEVDELNAEIQSLLASKRIILTKRVSDDKNGVI